MSEVPSLLARQAAWQRELRELSWEEKIRMAEAVRASVVLLRLSAPEPDASVPHDAPPGGSGGEPPRSS